MLENAAKGHTSYVCVASGPVPFALCIAYRSAASDLVPLAAFIVYCTKARLADTINASLVRYIRDLDSLESRKSPVHQYKIKLIGIAHCCVIFRDSELMTMKCSFNEYKNEVIPAL